MGQLSIPPEPQIRVDGALTAFSPDLTKASAPRRGFLFHANPFTPSLLSLRVGLLVRACLDEGVKLTAGGVNREDLGEAVERHFEPARVGDLRHHAYIGKRHVSASR